MSEVENFPADNDVLRRRLASMAAAALNPELSAEQRQTAADVLAQAGADAAALQAQAQADFQLERLLPLDWRLAIAKQR